MRTPESVTTCAECGSTDGLGTAWRMIGEALVPLCGRCGPTWHEPDGGRITQLTTLGYARDSDCRQWVHPDGRVITDRDLRNAPIDEIPEPRRRAMRKSPHAKR